MKTCIVDVGRKSQAIMRTLPCTADAKNVYDITQCMRQPLEADSYRHLKRAGIGRRGDLAEI